jgi:ubiquinone/menaquinone biosynthesis C-methylase UbiE/uncharacterized protein YbaR (Trm112 family)
VHRKLLEVLACPVCHGALTPSSKDERIEEGELACAPCGKRWPIVRGIPRFVPSGNYASSFGLQWNTFRAEQLDSLNGTDLSARRFFSETGWDPPSLRGRWMLDAGCGAGRFLDVSSTTGAEVVGLDLSNAVDAAARSLAGRENVHLVQASIYEMPFKPGVFDAVYCIGVIQHTPDPPRTLAILPSVLKRGGRIAVTIYEKRRFSKLYSKYWVRPLTKRLDKQLLLSGIRMAMPLLFPMTEVLFRLPRVGRLFQFAIPVANYTGESSLSIGQRYRWAVMDTFDMLAPEFDQPQAEAPSVATLEAAGIKNVRRLPNGGLNLVGDRA